MGMIAAEAHDKAAEIVRTGPSRVLVEPHHGVPWKRRPMFRLSTVFIRDDGWSLGTPESLVGHAYLMWKTHWEWVIEFGLADTGIVYPFKEWESMELEKWLTLRSQKNEDLYLRYTRP
ncbi:MAG: hypothetical protein ACYSW3_00095 [Planctomycetota bacterium]|jgi:hypothetical protein